MRKRVCALAVIAVAFTAQMVAAQTIDLGAGGADPIWRGASAGSYAGAWLDQGSLSAGDSRKDLIVGSPGGPGILGKVSVIFGGPVPTGSNVPLSSASTTITGATAGDLFGTTTSTGNVLNAVGSPEATLAVSAPAALNGRGIVYLFNSNFSVGDTISASSAAVQILGAPGDQLGKALVTADLNNDGYREVIIGAPGNNRVYVIGGGPNLPATIDLSASPVPAAAIYQFAGFGSVLATADITGDGIYDLIIGQPSNNAVWVVKGRSGTMPDGSIDMGFTGINPGDMAGTSLRVLDLDADGVRDLAIGAPGADGPDGARTDSGAVYILYGGSNLSSRSLASADVTFYGRDAGDRFGAVLAGGEINRDNPEDLVLGSTVANGGFGALYVYYGRSRGSIGTARPDGTRFIDFAQSSADREIWGDTGGGTITAVQVFEVSGEGARDIIVGMSGNNNNTGAVYCTLSPRLTLGTSSVSLTGYQATVTSSPVPVTNISVIAITWATSSNQPWLSATPQGSTSNSTPGQLQIAANGNGLAPGTYTGTVTVASTSIHLDESQTIAVTFTVQESLPNPSSPAASGAAPGARYSILWRNSDGFLAFWHMNGVSLTSMDLASINQMTNSNWRIAAFADLNGDGSRDIVWEEQTQGWLAVWFMQGNQVIGTQYLSINKIDPSWKIKAAGDVNGDGKADLIWQADDGTLAVWYMNGAQVIGTYWLSINKMSDTNWQIVGAGDLDGDGKADIVWQDKTDGWLGVWLMNGSQVVSTRILSIPKMTDPTWTIVGVQDVNGDGRADLLWQRDDGHVATWFMNADQVIATYMLNPSQVSNTSWRIQGPK